MQWFILWVRGEPCFSRSLSTAMVPFFNNHSEEASDTIFGVCPSRKGFLSRRIDFRRVSASSKQLSCHRQETYKIEAGDVLNLEPLVNGVDILDSEKRGLTSISPLTRRALNDHFPKASEKSVQNG